MVQTNNKQVSIAHQHLHHQKKFVQGSTVDPEKIFTSSFITIKMWLLFLMLSTCM